jgi:anion transporter
VSLARLVGALEEMHIPAGKEIVREGADADGLYLLDRGEVTVTIRSQDGDVEVATVTGPTHFGDMGVLLARRTATVRARTDSVVLRLPRGRFEQLVRERPDIALTVATTVAQRFEQRQRALIGAPEPEVEARPLTVAAPRAGRGDPRRRWAGALLSFAVPLTLWWAAPPTGLDQRGWHVVVLLLGAAIGWLFEPVPDFVVAIALAAAWGITGSATLGAVFGGFASSTWVLTLSALALAAAMAQSGLLFRVGLFLLRAFPATLTGQVLALVASGLALTPFVPQSVARVAAIAPVASELRIALGQPMRSAGSAALAFAGLVGSWYFSNLILTGFATNFFVLELVPAAERAQFGWGGWLVGSAVALAVCLIGGTAAVLILFRPEHPASLSRAALADQMRVIGGLSRAERIAAAAVLLLIAGLLVQPVLGIEPAWVAATTVVLAIAGVLGRDGFRTAVDWPQLVFFGILLGSGGVIQQNGIDKWLGASLRPLFEALGHPGTAVMALAIVVLLIRVLLPSRATMVLMGLVAMPVAPGLGISPWVAGVVVLMMANTWILPYQGFEYLLLREATRGESFTDAQGARMGAALVAVRLAAVALSVPYWAALGFIRS